MRGINDIYVHRNVFIMLNTKQNIIHTDIYEVQSSEYHYNYTGYIQLNMRCLYGYKN